jgi:hypothetical protein
VAALTHGEGSITSWRPSAARTSTSHPTLAAFIDARWLVPAIDSVHPVDTVQEALGLLERGAQLGKVVVSFP